MDWIVWAQDRDQWREGSCEHGNEPLGFIKCYVFLDKLTNYILQAKNDIKHCTECLKFSYKIVMFVGSCTFYGLHEVSHLTLRAKQARKSPPSNRVLSHTVSVCREESIRKLYGYSETGDVLNYITKSEVSVVLWCAAGENMLRNSALTQPNVT
jgi:hypothetical protein